MTMQNPFGMGLDVMRQLGASQSQIAQTQGEQQRQQMLQDQAAEIAAANEQAAMEAEQKRLFDMLANLQKLPDAQSRISAIQNSPFAQIEGIDQLMNEQALSDEGLAKLIYASPFEQAKREDQTAFMQEMIAAGITPGSEEYKATVLERYGKGKTIGFDIKEGVNPNSGQVEYFQASRTDPGAIEWLGIQVPPSPGQIQAEIDDAAAAETEADAIQQSLNTVGKLLNSPGLSGFSGLDQFRSWIPGSEAANVRAWVDQLQSQNFLTAVQQMKGMGALSENEGRKLSAAVAALSPSMTDEAFKNELLEIQRNLNAAQRRIEENTLLKGRPEADQEPTMGADQPKTVNWSDL